MISAFDILKIGIGPSSSHTLGPWKAAKEWSQALDINNHAIVAMKASLFGSLALTGKGHYTDKAIVLGWLQEDPETCEVNSLLEKVEKAEASGKIMIGTERTVHFSVTFYPDQSLPYHPNGMQFMALDKDGKEISSAIYYSIGGGFIIKEGTDKKSSLTEKAIPYPCTNAAQLAKICREENKSISDIVLANEQVFLIEEEIFSRMSRIWQVMKEAAYEGCHTEGILPGGLKVKRRAAAINKQLLRVHTYKNVDEWIEAMKVGRDFKKVITRISCLAIAVNEVNASMGRIVTAPTNGSAGVLPAVLFYYLCFSGQDTSEEDIARFLLTAAEIGKYFKLNATISAAAGGCQAEIGVSSSMAAAALTERMGGTVAQVLMAAEIAAEHHLGMTCDPIGGLVQIPCIERNSMGAVKALTASMIALASDPAHAKVSLDKVIQTMKETADNMSTRYKETSLGGLAISVGIAEC